MLPLKKKLSILSEGLSLVSQSSSSLDVLLWYVAYGESFEHTPRDFVMIERRVLMYSGEA